MRIKRLLSLLIFNGNEFKKNQVGIITGEDFHYLTHFWLRMEMLRKICFRC